MSVRMDDRQIYEINVSFEQWADHYLEHLETIENAISTFNGITSMEGDTATSIKNYFNESHIALISMLKSYLEQFKAKQAVYLETLTQLDTHVDAILDVDTLNQCVTDFTSIKTDFEEEVVALKTYLGSIMDLADMLTDYYYAGGEIASNGTAYSIGQVATDSDELSVQLVDLNDSEYTNEILPLHEYGVTINNLIEELKNKDTSAMYNYQLDDIKAYGSYADAMEGYELSEAYNETVDDSVGDLIDADFQEHIHLEDELSAGAIKEVVGSGVGVASGIKTIGVGGALMLVPGTQAVGICVIVAGVAQTVTSIGDCITGICGYGKAAIEGDLYYEHESFTDKVIVDQLLGGNEVAGKGLGIVGSMVSTFGSTYKTTKNPWVAAGTAAFDPIKNELLVPWLSDLANVDPEGENQEDATKLWVGKIADDILDIIIE